MGLFSPAQVMQNHQSLEYDEIHVLLFNSIIDSVIVIKVCCYFGYMTVHKVYVVIQSDNDAKHTMHPGVFTTLQLIFAVFNVF